MVPSSRSLVDQNTNQVLSLKKKKLTDKLDENTHMFKPQISRAIFHTWKCQAYEQKTLEDALPTCFSIISLKTPLNSVHTASSSYPFSRLMILFRTIASVINSIYENRLLYLSPQPVFVRVSKSNFPPINLVTLILLDELVKSICHPSVHVPNISPDAVAVCRKNAGPFFQNTLLHTLHK